ncbi:MAG: hypothetical protein LBC42_03995 [Puniceicoccales bacterium]|jgi:protein arginine kinase|nr:hypothetical protein [Puniceicoccales bacterium]
MNSLLISHARTTPCWVTGKEPVIISSRIRIARNFAGERFPSWATSDMQLAQLSRGYEALRKCNGDFHFWQLRQLAVPERPYFQERRMCGKNFLASGSHVAIAEMHNLPMQVRFNDGEHVKISTIMSGLQLREAHSVVNGVDDEMARYVEFAFDDKKGYLAAFPENLGTGLRASLLFFLPGLVATERISQILYAAQTIGCAIGGFSGTGTEADGCFFQICNRSSLGESEEEILRRMHGVGEAIRDQELMARRELERTLPEQLGDRFSRVLGMLTSARCMSFAEALSLLSQARLAACMEIFPSELIPTIDAFIVELQPIHLQLIRNVWITGERQETLRAEQLRKAFTGIALR